MIAHNRPDLGPQEAQAAARAVRSGWVARGEETAAFERELAAYLGLAAEHVVITSSGTSALFLALHALGARSKTVAIPGYVCAAVRNAVIMAGAQAQAIDNEPDSPNISIEGALASGCEIAIAAHMYGIPQDVSRLARAIPTIEDCAQAFGARVGDKPAGLAGHVGITSFYATKLLTAAGAGGAVFSRDRSIIDAIRDYLDFDCRTDERPRFNFQATDVQSAVGRAQLARYPEFLARREAIFQRYRARGVQLLDAPAGARAVRYRAVARTSQPQACISKLAERGVTAIVPTADWELPADARLPNARALARTSISLPIYPALSEEELLRISDALDAVVA